jgi:hypothetical protein
MNSHTKILLTMKRLFQLSVFCLIGFQCIGQMVMSAEGINPDNVCMPNTVYFLMEKRARPIESIDSIELRLNNSISFVKQNPTFESKPAIQFAVNCKGEAGGGFHMVTRSGNDLLDKELIEFFKSIKTWKPGMIKKRTVDSWYMWRLEIKNGYINITNI